MIDLGYYALLGAFVFSLYGLVVASAGAVRRQMPLILSAENAVVAASAMAVASAASLWYLILSDRFEVEFVATVSSTTIPLVYKITALWGGQSGSLLFWLLLLGVLSAIAVLGNRNSNRGLMPYVTPVLAGTLAFFAGLSFFVSNPFKLISGGFVPPDGNGLNPLLQNYWMAIHPPILYTGLISTAIPFAFGMGALMSGRLDTAWIPTTRRWAIFCWTFLTLGFTLGGVWAYEELGWGGYWAWDPVENSSFMPWLAMSAFVHSIMITEKKGMLKTWNFVLLLLAYELTVFGTFITRSGVVQSVHAFARSDIGYPFAAFLTLSTFFGLFWISYRSKSLKGESKMHSFLSREASFLLNNLLFLVFCFFVFWGTVFPIVSEAVTGEKITVAAPFFNKFAGPVGLALLTLTGICPLIAWRKASARNFRRNFLYPIFGGLAGGFVALASGARGWMPLLFFSSCGFVAATIFFEFFKGARARQSIKPSGFVTALTDLTMMNKRRYGGFIVHLGAVLVFVGIVGSSYFRQEETVTVKAGETFQIGERQFRFVGLRQERDAEKEATFGLIDERRNGDYLGRFYPQLHFHFKQQQQVSEVAIHSTLREDVYFVISAWDDQGNVTFHVFINPVVTWIWIGIGIMVAGGVFVMFPDRKPRKRAAVSDETTAARRAA